MENHRKSPRARWIEYNQGAYFITICTADHRHFFGEIERGIMLLSDIGRFTDEQLAAAHRFNPDIEVPLHVVMPNHIHFVIYIDDSRDAAEVRLGDPGDMRAPNAYYRANSDDARHIPVLSRYINQLKGAVTRYARRTGIEFCWQSLYYDEQIRSERQARFVQDYIDNNIAKWSLDKYCDYIDDSKGV